MPNSLELIAFIAIKTLITLAIILAGLSIILRSKKGVAFAGSIGVMAFVVFISFLLLQPITTMLENSIKGKLVLVVWLAAGVIAYFIREERKGKTNSDLRSAERTPVAPQHLDGERQR